LALVIDDGDGLVSQRRLVAQGGLDVETGDVKSGKHEEIADFRFGAYAMFAEEVLGWRIRWKCMVGKREAGGVSRSGRWKVA